MQLFTASNAPIRDETAEMHYNGNNHIQNFHLGRIIVGYTFGNHVLRLPLRVAVKLNFRPYIRRYTSPNENFEYSYPLISILLKITTQNLRKVSNQPPLDVKTSALKLIVLQISRLSEGSTGQIFATSSVIYQMKMWGL